MQKVQRKLQRSVTETRRSRSGRPSRSSVVEAARTICEQPPDRPGTLLRTLRGDLETIVLKCLEKKPEDRYGSAEALAQDLDRCARGDPIEARPLPFLERTARRVYRHRVKLAAAVRRGASIGVFVPRPPKTRPTGARSATSSSQRVTGR